MVLEGMPQPSAAARRKQAERPESCSIPSGVGGFRVSQDNARMDPGLGHCKSINSLVLVFYYIILHQIRDLQNGINLRNWFLKAAN